MTPLAGAIHVATTYGLRVFPIKCNGRIPLIAGWPALATADVAQINSWAAKFSNCNWGIDTTGYLVIDADVKHDPAAISTAVDLGVETRTFTVRTTTNGAHFWHSTAIDVACSTSRIAYAIDIKAWHGFCIAPGSVLNGKAYWIELDLPIAKAPLGLAAMCDRPTEPGNRGKVSPHVEFDTPAALAQAVEIAKAAAAVAEGGRNDAAYPLACKIRGVGVSELPCFEILKEHWDSRNLPPLDDEDGLEKPVINAYIYARGMMGGKRPEHIFHGIEVEPPPPGSPPPPPSAPATASEFPDRVSDPLEDQMAAVPYPDDVLPNVIREYVLERGESTGVDVAAHSTCAVHAMASSLDPSFSVRVKVHDDEWYERATLWEMIIGESSDGKSVAMRTATAPMRKAQRILAANYKAAAEIHEAMHPSVKKQVHPDDAPKKPTKFLTADATVEALQELLKNQDRGVCVIRDEIAGLIGSFDRYEGRQGNLANRAFYLEAYDGDTYDAARISRGPVYITRLAIPILGGTQPDRILSSMRDLSDDGMLQRFCFTILGRPRLPKDRPNGLAVENYKRFITWLLSFKRVGDTSLRLVGEGIEIREALESELLSARDDRTMPRSFKSFCGKLPGKFARLALAFQIAEDPNATVISSGVARRVDRLIRDFIVPNAVQFYQFLGGSTRDRDVLVAIIDYLITRQGDARNRVRVSDLSANVWACRGGGIAEIQKFAGQLEHRGFLLPEAQYNPRAWKINPAMYQQFAKRAADEIERRSNTRGLILKSAEQRRQERGMPNA